MNSDINASQRLNTQNEAPVYRSGWDHSYRTPTQATNRNQQLVPEEENTFTEQISPISASQYSQQYNNWANSAQTTITYQYTSIDNSLQLLFNEINLLCTAGEITEVEAADLKQLAAQGDNRVKEAIRYHSLGDSRVLIQLLHRNDTEIDLLYRRDYTFANSLQTQDIVEQQMFVDVPFQPQPVDYGIRSQYLTNRESSSFIRRSYDTIPHLFFCDNLLCGLIMKRTKTKVFFKKWKHCIFVVKSPRLLLYQSIEDWKQDRAVYFSLDLLPTMTLSPVIVKHKDQTQYYCIEIRVYNRERRIENSTHVLLASSYLDVVTTLKTKLEEVIHEL